MEKRIPVTQFITRTLTTFSIIMLFLLLVGPIVGDDAGKISTLFREGVKGIPYSVVLQALGVGLYTTAVRAIFMSNRLFKKMMVLWRTIWTFTVIFIGVGILSIVFGWFPANAPIAWVSYLLSFGAAAGLSALVMLLKTRYDNARVNEKFEEYLKQKRAEQAAQKEI